MQVPRMPVIGLSIGLLAACATPHAPRVDCTKHLQPINVPASLPQKAAAVPTAKPKHQKDRAR